MAVPDAAPSETRAPSPKATVTFWIDAPLPAAGTAEIVKVVGVSAVGFAPGAIDTLGTGRGATDTDADAEGPMPGSPLTEPCAPTVAVTVAVWDVVSVVFALPSASVFTAPSVSVPAVAENVTGMLASGLPAPSTTVALIALAPPENGTVGGSATTATRDAAAAPIAIRRAPSGAVAAAPALAVMTAVPEMFPARNATVARPCFVSPCAGSMVPSVVANETSVPSAAKRPVPSTMSAVIVAAPPNGSWVAD